MTAPHAHAKEATAGTAGAAASTGVYQAGGFKMKLAAQRKGAKAPSGVSRSKYEKTIKEHQRAHGAYHGGEPTWLGAKGKLGHKVGLVTGQGPTAHVNAARHWPTKIEGVSVPGAKIRRVMGYTHGGKTGLAVGAATAALGAGAALSAEHHHLKKAASDRDMRTRVIRRGPYTKQNRKQLRHHMGVGAGVGGAVGVAGGAHLGAYIHSSAVKQMMSRPGARFAKLPSRGKVALAVAGGLGAVGALQGASVGHDVARMQRHQAKRAMPKRPKKEIAKAEPLAIAGKLWRKPTLRSEFTRAFGGTRKGEKLVARAHHTPKVTHGRDAYGYPKKTWTGESHGPEVKAGFRAYAAREASNSPHRTSFKAGAATARAVTAAGKRPEYAISVPAVGAGAGLIHHEVKGKKKGTAVAKSAFGVEISKDRTKKGAVIGGAAGVAGSQATLHYKVHRMAGPAFHDQSFGRKVAAHGRVAPKLARSMVSSRSRVALAGNIATGAVAGALIGRQRDKVAAQSDTMAKSAFSVEIEKSKQGAKKGAIIGGASGAVGAQAGVHAFAHADMRVNSAAYRSAGRGAQALFHLKRAPRVAVQMARPRVGLPLTAMGVGAGAAVGAGVGALRRKKKPADTMAKSAFGVVEKNAFTSGINAVRGFKGAVTGAVGAERTAAGAAGKVAGAATMGKLKPVGAAMTKTKARTATTAGLGGIGLGLSANKNA